MFQKVSDETQKASDAAMMTAYTTQTTYDAAMMAAYSTQKPYDEGQKTYDVTQKISDSNQKPSDEIKHQFPFQRLAIAKKENRRLRRFGL